MTARSIALAAVVAIVPVVTMDASRGSADLRVAVSVPQRCVVSTAAEGTVRVRCTRGTDAAVADGAAPKPIRLAATDAGRVEGAAAPTTSTPSSRTVTVLF